MLRKMRIPNEIIERKYMNPQVKYMISLILTTEKQPNNTADRPPSKANAKKQP